MQQRLLVSLLVYVFSFWIGIQGSAQAWDEHYRLMPFILPVQINAATENLRPILNRTDLVPCKAVDDSEFDQLAQEFHLNSKGKVPPTSTLPCGPTNRISVGEILRGTSVDDPDLGMDGDLPEKEASLFDPNQDRPWMGGSTGPTSQGFRHMYFGGWKITRPILTFQIPFRPIGRSPERIILYAQKAKGYVSSGKLAWGTRLTAWALHYLQDMTQPFHTAQLLNLKMVPWSALFSWPPEKAIHQLIEETIRVVTNYHWAYEGYILNHFKQSTQSPLQECLIHPEKFSKFNFDSKTQSLQELIDKITEASLDLASELGSAQVKMFGSKVAAPGIQISLNPHLLPYAEYATSPVYEEARTELERLTCKALANTSLSSRKLIEWVFQ